MSWQQTVKTYYRITKPGIIRGNVITGIGGFLFAAMPEINWVLFGSFALGNALIIASACVYNNYIDRHIDAKMKRTQSRAVANGQVGKWPALIYASVLGIIGVVVLILGTNWLTVGVGVAAHFFYVVIYGYAKRASHHGTLVGTIPGAASILGGYVAATNSIDLSAILLFIILVLWQMPHFYAIAIMSMKDYAAAGIPVLPVAKGLQRTRREIIIYTFAFSIAVILLGYISGIEWVYLVVMIALCGRWLQLAWRGLRTKEDFPWAKQMFKYSLSTLSIFSLLISILFFLP